MQALERAGKKGRKNKCRSSTPKPRGKTIRTMNKQRKVITHLDLP